MLINVEIDRFVPLKCIKWKWKSSIKYNCLWNKNNYMSLSIEIYMFLNFDKTRQLSIKFRSLFVWMKGHIRVCFVLYQFAEWLISLFFNFIEWMEGKIRFIIFSFMNFAMAKWYYYGKRFQNIAKIHLSYQNEDIFATSLKPIPRLFAFFNHVSIKLHQNNAKISIMMD